MYPTIRAALIVCATLTGLACGTVTAQAAPQAPTAAGSGLTGQLQVTYLSKCLTIADASMRAGAHVIEGTCDSTADNQVFTLRPGAKGGWELVAKHSGRCVTHVENATPKIVQRWCDGSTSQLWRTEYLDGAAKSLFRLRPEGAPTECLSMGGTPAGEEPVAYVVDCFDKMPSQQWRIIPAA